MNETNEMTTWEGKFMIICKCKCILCACLCGWRVPKGLEKVKLKIIEV